MKKFILLNIILLTIVSVKAQDLTLVYPNNGLVTNDSIINFQWNLPDIDFNTYNLQISTDSRFLNLNVDIINLSDNYLIIDTFKQKKNYYWRVRSHNGSNFSGWSNTRAFSTFSPNSINSIGLWLDADSNIVFESGKVKEWHDLSPNNNHLIQTDTDNQPLWTNNSINNHPSVSFTSSNEFLNFTDSVEKVGVSIYAIAQNKEQTYGSYILGKAEVDGVGLFFNLNKSSATVKKNRKISLDHQDYDNFVYIKYLYDTVQYGDYWQSYYAKLQINTEISDSSSMYGYPFICDRLGYTAWYGTYKKFNGELAELIIYYSPIKDSLNVLVEQYLRYKYAPPVNLGYNIHIPYGFCDTIIDAGEGFTNYLWSTGDTTQTITVNKSGQYSVIVTDIFGFQSTDSLVVYYPKTNQYLSDSLICYGDTISWNAGLQDTNYTFLWQDNSTDSLLQIYSDGNYYVQITDTNSCKYQSDTIRLTLDNYPITTNLGDDDTLCTYQNLYLHTGADATVNYLWDTGDTTCYTVIDNTRDYSVTVTNEIGCVAKDTVHIYVKGKAPSPGFWVQYQCFNDSTEFIDTSKVTDLSNITNWFWNFGNGDTSNIQNPKIQYADTGVYQIQLRIVTDSLCENRIEKEIKIYANPEAHFSTSQLCQNQTISFNNTSLSAMGEINYVHWDFGNNDTTNAFSTEHIFSEEGEQVIHLKVRTTNACEDILDSTLKIKPSPKANFSYTPLCLGEDITFFDETEISGVLSIVNWQWESSLGDISTLQNPHFTFPNSQYIQMKLKATSVNGCADTVSQKLWIYENPTANFVAQNSCLNNLIEVENLSTDTQSTILNYYWWLNGNLISQQEKLNYTIEDTGIQRLKLKIISESNCSDTLEQLFMVFPTPNSLFTVSQNYTTPNIKLIFKADSINTDNQYLYNFGDGYTQNTSQASHFYSKEGYYESSLIVKNQYNCSDSTKIAIGIVEPQLDLAIEQLHTFDENGKTKISFLLSNIGNLDINNIDFRIEMNNGTVFEENSKEKLSIGESRIQELNSQFLFDANKTHYLCILAKVNSIYEDINLNNNLECTSYKITENLIKIYPNPVTHQLIVLYQNNKEQNINYEIIDILGRVVLSGTWQTYEEIYKYSLDVTHLSSGVYTLRINDSLKKFVKE